MEDSNDTGKIIGALIIGALAGAAIGILFAPDKGSKTREKISDESKKIAKKLRKKMEKEANDLAAKAEGLKSFAKETMENFTNGSNQKAEN
jgi:gas vesicle protein